MKLMTALCCTQSGVAIWCTMGTPFSPNDLLSQNAARRPQFFQFQAIITSQFLMTYSQTSDIFGFHIHSFPAWTLQQLKFQDHRITLQIHCMAFNKTKSSYFVCSFQNWIKKSTLKNHKFAISCPRPLFCLSCKLPGIKPASTAELPTTVNHLDQKAKHSGERMLSFCVYESILICRMVNFHSLMVKIPFPYISPPKTPLYFSSQNPNLVPKC